MITAIVQARLGSTRLPKKVLLPFGERTVLEEVLWQVHNTKYIDRVFVTTPDPELRDKVYDMGATCYLWSGDEDDIIGRYYQVATIPNQAHADPIVRITSDCPLILPEVIDLVIKAHFEERAYYTFNRCDSAEGEWPDGLDIEVFDFEALQTAYVLAEEREDMQWIRDNFKYYQVPCEKDYGECTSINTQEDYEKALEIYSNRLK